MSWKNQLVNSTAAEYSPNRTSQIIEETVTFIETADKKSMKENHGGNKSAKMECFEMYCWLFILYHQKNGLIAEFWPRNSYALGRKNFRTRR